ncbi:hypothetical protein ACFQL7_20155 [Halocatena marina]|uniref:Uncharacterized protein n=1 Tax=Halocatena marina TaxID=2934937 RepID=A0ABD5YVC4_9EURY|nr:hypothetical protein [Halocatena marina]
MGFNISKYTDSSNHTTAKNTEAEPEKNETFPERVEKYEEYRQAIDMVRFTGILVDFALKESDEDKRGDFVGRSPLADEYQEWSDKAYSELKGECADLDGNLREYREAFPEPENMDEYTKITSENIDDELAEGVLENAKANEKFGNDDDDVIYVPEEWEAPDLWYNNQASVDNLAEELLDTVAATKGIDREGKIFERIVENVENNDRLNEMADELKEQLGESESDE